LRNERRKTCTLSTPRLAGKRLAFLYTSQAEKLEAQGADVPKGGQRGGCFSGLLGLQTIKHGLTHQTWSIRQQQIAINTYKYTITTAGFWIL